MLTLNRDSIRQIIKLLHACNSCEFYFIRMAYSVGLNSLIRIKMNVLKMSAYYTN